MDVELYNARQEELSGYDPADPERLWDALGFDVCGAEWALGALAARPELARQKLEHGMTLLMRSIHCDQYDAFRALLPLSDANAACESGFTALMFAAGSEIINRPKYIGPLLPLTDERVARVDDGGATALSLALRLGDRDGAASMILAAAEAKELAAAASPALRRQGASVDGRSRLCDSKRSALFTQGIMQPELPLFLLSPSRLALHF